MFKDISGVLSQNKVRHEPVQLTDVLGRRIYRYSLSIIVICSAFIVNQYVVNNSINCHAPVSVGDDRSFVNYLNNYGWINLRSTRSSLAQLYAKDNDHENPSTPSFAYYYWMPFILMFQALMVWFPHQLWDYFCRRSTGRDYIELMEKAKKAAQESKDNENVRALRMDLIQMAEDNKEVQCDNVCQRIGEWFRMRGSKLVIVHFLVTVMCWLISLGQLCFMMRIFGFENPIKYTNELLTAITSGAFINETSQFPRMIYLRLRDLLSSADNINLVAQCILPMNMVIEKIVIILSLWFLFVALLQTLQLLSLILSQIFYNQSRNFIKDLLRLPKGNSNDKQNQIIDGFTRTFLRRDGVFIIKMMKMISGPSLASEITLQMYRVYRDQTPFFIQRIRR